jgi:hypothetical protein
MMSKEIEKLYLDHTKQLVERSSIKIDEIFPFIEGSPLDYELKKGFLFYYKELKENIGHNLEPSYVFIVNDRKFNAFAKKEKNGSNIIGINVGIVRHLYDLFGANDDLKSSLKDKFSKFPATDLMFDTAMHFTFYHELGHLIQNSSVLENSLSGDEKVEFSLKKHILEYDADQFASIVIGGHIATFTIDNLGEKVSSTDIEDVLITVCTSILFYLLSSPSSKHELYFEECGHPHPTIRIVNIVFTIIHHHLSTLKNYGVSAEIDPDKIVADTIKLAESLNLELIQQDRLSSMRTSIAANVHEISDYMEFLRFQKSGDRSMSTYKWNQFAKSYPQFGDTKI